MSDLAVQLPETSRRLDAIDRKILMVAKDEHERVVAELARARVLVQTAVEMLGRVAHSTPRAGQWERSYRALQEQARDSIGKLRAAPA